MYRGCGSVEIDATFTVTGQEYPANKKLVVQIVTPRGPLTSTGPLDPCYRTSCIEARRRGRKRKRHCLISVICQRCPTRLLFPGLGVRFRIILRSQGPVRPTKKAKLRKLMLPCLPFPTEEKKRKRANLIYCAVAEYQTSTLWTFLMKYGSFNEREVRLFKQKTSVSQKVKKIEGRENYGLRKEKRDEKNTYYGQRHCWSNKLLPR